MSTAARQDSTSPLPAAAGGGEVEKLRAHVRDLAALLALPVMWRTAEPASIVASLTEVLIGLLRVDVAYARCADRAEGLDVDAIRPSTLGSPHENGLLGCAESPHLPYSVPHPRGGGRLHLARVIPPRTIQEWTVVAGSSREGFPTAEERFLLQVAADQAALAVEMSMLIAAERRSRSEAEVANRAKSAFLASMSHELRTPLNAIGGYVELMELGLRGPITPEQAEDFARIRRSGRHLLSLINDVLNFAKIEAGQLAFSLEEMAVKPILDEVSELMAPQLRAKRIAYLYEPPPEALTIHADPERLRQVLLNLLSNAIKFTAPEGRVELTTATSADHVELRVRDTGCGIPQDTIATIFEPFVQVHRSLNEPTQGTGLGLAISRELTRGMGGTLTVESTVGVGSTFVLELPRSAASRDAGGEAEESQSLVQ